MSGYRVDYVRDGSPKPNIVSNGAQLPKIQSHTASLAAVAAGAVGGGAAGGASCVASALGRWRGWIDGVRAVLSLSKDVLNGALLGEILIIHSL